ncbi:MAG TPA: hypothetical protein VEK08_19480 [Planctomycetota bacterium]|nr:hypothetical protein [Planctomycetota bacterium]
MNVARWSLPLAAALLSLAPLCAGKESKKPEEKPKEQPIAWTQKMVPGPAVLLRIKREEGKILIYDGTLNRTQDSVNSYIDSSAFYLTFLCAARREEKVNGRPAVLDLVCIRRTYTNRDREEKLENGKTVKRPMQLTEDQISIGENYEKVGSLNCLKIDSQNCAAFMTQQLAQLKDGRSLRGSVLSEENDKIVFQTSTDLFNLKRDEIASMTYVPQPHVILDESPHYLFPPLPSQKKSPGETWRFRIPVVIPVQQGNPPRILPTMFQAVVDCRLCEVKQAGNSQTALIEYKVAGVFDSAGEEFAARFTQEFHDAMRIIHRMNGEGLLHLDVEKGRILEKSENFNFFLYGKNNAPQPEAEKPAKGEKQEKKERPTEQKADINSQYHMKLMLPGQRLRNNVVVPNYD